MEAPLRPCFLAVDDEPCARHSYCGLLRKYGDAVVVQDVPQAKEALAGNRPFAAFFFDLRLPFGNGLELLAEARPSYPHTPAMILSGYVQGWVVNEAFDLGADVLAKPFEVPRMHRWIEQVLGLTHPAPAESLDPPAIRERIQTLRDLLARTPATALTRYRIGAIVVELKARPDLYGAGAVTIAAAAVGLDEANLYRFGRVTGRWTVDEFKALLSRTMQDGRSPSWSHLVLLAAVEREDLPQLFDRMLDECWSVRQLDDALDSAGVGEDYHRR